MTQRGDGIGVGWNNHTSGDVIRDDRIHNVGFCPVEEHGIYINKTSGIQVYGNWIYDIPAGTGIQLWDGPTDAHIYANVIDNTSSCVDVGGNTPVTAGNLIQHNVCSNMVGVQQPYKAYCANPGPGCTGPDHGRPLFDYWASGPGRGNVMQNNLTYCASTAHCSTSFAGASGVATSGNVTANPQFADSNYQTSHDYRVASGSPAASWGLWTGGSVPVTASAASFHPRARKGKHSHKAAKHHARRSHKVAGSRPRTPTRLRATAGNGQITVSWAASAAGEQVTHYNVYRTGQAFKGAWATPTATKFANASGVVKGKKYCYQLSATNRIGQSAKSAPVCAQL